MKRLSRLTPVLVSAFIAGPACDYDKAAPGRAENADVAVVPEQDTSAPAPDTSAPSSDTTVTPPAPDAGSPAPPDSSEPWQHPPIVGVQTGTGEEAPLDPMAPPAELRTRSRQRMDINQLDTAFSTVLDGITWTMRVGSNDLNQFTVLSETLGVPDFLDTTFEDLGPTSLFQKFLGDAARKACADRITADLALLGPDGAPNANAPKTPVLFGELGTSDTIANAADRVEQQISALLLRFHGRRIGRGDGSFSEWRWLHESSTQLTGSATQAWQAVCVALLTHPDFYTY